jgi:hypothetical protein
MWDFLTALLQSQGFSALVIFAEAGAIAYLYRRTQKRHEEIVQLYQKRVQDIKESRDDYEELARNLDKSIDLLIKVFRQRNGG